MRYEIHPHDRDDGVKSMCLERLDTYTKLHFPLVVWGPCAGFAFGEVKALFANREDAEDYVRVRNGYDPRTGR